MFPDGMFPDGAPDLQSLLQQAQNMQDRLVSAQRELEEARVEGDSGGGLVTATVTGTGDLVSLRIDPQACDPTDTETLADLIVAAVHHAVERAHESAAEALGDVTGGFGGDSPTGLGDSPTGLGDFSGFLSPQPDDD